MRRTKDHKRIARRRKVNDGFGVQVIGTFKQLCVGRQVYEATQNRQLPALKNAGARKTENSDLIHRRERECRPADHSNGPTVLVSSCETPAPIQQMNLGGGGKRKKYSALACTHRYSPRTAGFDVLDVRRSNVGRAKVRQTAVGRLGQNTARSSNECEQRKQRKQL